MTPRPILVVGAAGTLGSAFVRLSRQRGLAHRGSSRRDLDAADAGAVAAMLERDRPWAVIHAAGYVRVDEAEREPERCRRDNVEAAVALAQACAAIGVRLMTFSSDLVFDGQKAGPYDEDDAPAPLSVYGQTKHEAERRVLALHPGALVVRTSAFFGPWDEHNFVTQSLERLRRGARVVAADDVTVSPTYVPDLVHTSLDLLVDGESGIWHLCSAGATSWAELARRAAGASRPASRLVEGVPVARMGFRAARPRNSALVSRRGWLMPSLDDALTRYHRERAEHLAEAPRGARGGMHGH
jgi:dTDP-4-dehydrorhamnose reductase